MARKSNAVTVAEAAPPVVAPSPGIKKLSLGGLVKPESKSKSEYPTLPDKPEIAPIVAAIIKGRAEIKALEGSVKTLEGQLKEHTVPFYFWHWQNRSDVASSVECQSGDKSLLFTVQDRYKGLPTETEATLATLIGPDKVAKLFKQSFELSINGDLLMEVIPDKAGDLITDLQALFLRYGASAALGAKETIRPTSSFHVARHTELSPDQNLALNEVLPLWSMLKTKGSK